jgi:hypothetical protein
MKWTVNFLCEGDGTLNKFAVFYQNVIIIIPTDFF